jgi:hypothetical protein
MGDTVRVTCRGESSDSPIRRQRGGMKSRLHLELGRKNITRGRKKPSPAHIARKSVAGAFPRQRRGICLWHDQPQPSIAPGKMPSPRSNERKGGQPSRLGRDAGPFFMPFWANPCTTRCRAARRPRPGSEESDDLYMLQIRDSSPPYGGSE